jgi:hypothetical protein
MGKGLIPKMVPWIALILAIFLSAWSPCFSEPPPGKERAAATALVQISWSTADGSVRVQVKGDGLLRNYSILQLSGPSRLVLDFPGLANATGKSEFQIGHRLLTSIRIGQHTEKTRVVFQFREEGLPHKKIDKREDSLNLLFSQEMIKEELPRGEREDPAGGQDTDRGIAPGVQRPGPGDGKISLVYQDADIRLVIQKIGEAARRNLAMSDAVQGPITLRLIDVPWEDALDIILRNRNLAILREGEGLRIITQEEYNQKRK